MLCLSFIENEERLTKSKQTASLWYLKTQYGLKWPKERDFKGKELGGGAITQDSLMHCQVA